MVSRVAHLANQDDVRLLAQGPAHGDREAERVHLHLALGKDRRLGS